MRWFLVIIIVCCYGFLKEFKPIEPFLGPYMRLDKNISNYILYSEVYTVGTYSYLVTLIPVFILTDLLRYKPVVLLESVAFVTTWVLLLWGEGVTTMQLMQFAYGWAMATEVAYYSYIYVTIDKQHYQRATSYVRAAVQAGKCLAYAIAQVIISEGFGDYYTLNYISLASVTLTFLVALCLPWISWRSSEVVKKEQKKDEQQQIKYCDFVRLYFKGIGRDFLRVYSSGFMCKWAMWWALATCGFYQIGNFIQTLWDEFQENTSSGQKHIYNGATEATNTFLGALTAFLMQFVHIRWEKWGELALAIISGIDCVILIIMSYGNSLLLEYIFYVIFRVLYQMMITVAQYNLARKMVSESYGLVFGFNTFIALVIESIMTFVVADDKGWLKFDIRTQFLVYGCYHGAIGIVFLLMGFVTLRNTTRVSNLNLTEMKDDPSTSEPVYRSINSGSFVYQLGTSQPIWYQHHS